MKQGVALAALILTLAAAPAPLVVGSVRDQLGAPISGALVTGGGASTLTAPDGTFALEAADISAVRVSCTYCLAQTIAVANSEPVVAIVRRHEALAFTAPTERDLVSAPYARAESMISLRPFIVFSDSRSPLPGPHLSDRAASALGGANVENGIPDYDVVANVSMLPAIPFYALRSSQVDSAGAGSYHGDQSNGGVFFLSDLPPRPRDALAMSGADTALRLAQAGGNTSYAVGASSNAASGRGRASGQLRIPVEGDSLVLGALADRSSNGSGINAIDNELQGFRAEFGRVRSAALNAALTIDRAGYDTSSFGAPLSAYWSDVAGEISLTSQTPVRLTADFGYRESTGAYEADAFRLRIGGTARQTHAAIAAEGESGRLMWNAGAAGYSIAFNGGSTGFPSPMNGAAIVPWLSFSYDLSPQWNFTAAATRSFRLPTMLEAYGLNPRARPLDIDRQSQLSQTLTYSDLQRLKLSFTMMNESVDGLDRGFVRSSGIALSWQIAPALALRAWTLFFDDETQPSAPVLRFGRPVRSATPGSAWLTYDNPGGVRTDVIYRSDLLDGAPDRHLDASISLPARAGLRWFFATERRQDVRTFDAGLRFEAP